MSHKGMRFARYALSKYASELNSAQPRYCKEKLTVGSVAYEQYFDRRFIKRSC